MADVVIQEPSDIDVSEITDLNMDRYAMIMYKQDQTSGGIKQLVLGSLKRFLNYSSTKSDNIAKLIGFPKDSGTDNTKYDYNGEVTIPSGAVTVLQSIQAVADQAGVSTTPSSFDKSVSTRVSELEDYVVNGYDDSGVSKDGLLTRVTNNESEIDDLWSQVGGGGGGGSSTLTTRVSSLEDKMGNNALPTGTTVTEMIGSTALPSGETLSHLTTDMNIKIGDESTANSILGRIKTAETNISDLTTTTGGLTTTTEGHTVQIDAINDILGSRAPSTGTVWDNIRALKTTVSSTYKYMGSLDSTSVTAFVAKLNAGECENGEVYNCSEAISFDYPVGTTNTYREGENFAVVKHDGQTPLYTLDSLGMGVDLTDIENRLTNINAEITALKARYGQSVDSNWTSGTMTGSYIFGGSVIISGSQTSIGFMATLDNGIVIGGVSGVSKINSSFDNIFTVNTTGKIDTTPLQSVAVQNFNLTWNKIGG